MKIPKNLKQMNESAFQKIWEVFLKYRKDTVPYWKIKAEIIDILTDYTIEALQKGSKQNGR